MPIYDYICTACDHRSDILHGINDPGPNFCPSCGKEGTMRKLFSAPSIHSRGSGGAKKDRGGNSKAGSKPSKPAESGEKPTSSSASHDKTASDSKD